MKKSKKRQVQKHSQHLKQIEELKTVDIFEYLSNQTNKESTLVQQLEELLPEAQDSFLMSFAYFYLKATGLAQTLKFIEGKNLDDIKFEDLIQKIEKLQQQNEQSLINEQQCLKLIEKTTEEFSFSNSLFQFYSIIFSTSTDIPFSCKQFLEFHFKWLTEITRCKIRLVRQAGIEIISMMADSIIKLLNDMKNNQIENQCIKFLNNIYDYLVTQRSHDVIPLIRRKVVQIMFKAFNVLKGDPYYENIGYLFISEHYDCREQALSELEHQYQETIKHSKPNQEIFSLIEQEQESIISLIFDPNESIQVKFIRFLKIIMVSNQKLSRQVFSKQTLSAVYRQLFCKNPRLRYEIVQIIDLLNPSIIPSSSEKPNTQALQALIKFYQEYQCNDEVSFTDYSDFFISFIPQHTYLLNPNTYMELMLENQNVTILNSQLILYSFAATIDHASVLTSQTTNFWWVEISEEQQHLLQQVGDRFTFCFLEKLASINIPNEDQLLIEAYLQVYLRINFKQFDSIMFRGQLKTFFECLLRIFQKQQTESIINLVCQVLSTIQEQLNTNQFVKDKITELVDYTQKVLESSGQNISQALVYKIHALISFNLVVWNTLITSEIQYKLLSLIKTDDTTGLTISVIKLLGGCLQSSLRNLIKNFKSLNEDSDNQYKDMRSIFYDRCFMILSQKQINQTYSEVLLQVIINLVYTNNSKLLKMGYHQILTKTQFEILYQSIDQLVLKDLQAKKEQSDSIDCGRRSLQSVEQIPQLSSFQFQLLKHVLQLLTTSVYCFDNQTFGLPIVAKLIKVSLTDTFFRERTSLMSKLLDTFQKIIEMDNGSKNSEFWRIVQDLIHVINTADSQESDEVYGEVAKIIIQLYLKNVNKHNLKEFRDKFVGFCADSVYLAYSNTKQEGLLNFLNQVFNKPARLIKQLEIDKSTYKKLCAFFEVKSNEFHCSDNINDEDKKDITKREAILRQRLRQQVIDYNKQTGLSSSDLNKLISDGDKGSANKSSYGVDKQNQSIQDEQNEVERIDESLTKKQKQ